MTLVLLPRRVWRLLALPVAAAALGLAACTTSADTTATGDIRVLASFYPLQFVAEQVGGDLVDVSSLTPPGAEPHDVELSPAQVSDVERAGLVVYLSDFQPAVDDAVAAVRPAHVVDAATLTTLLPVTTIEVGPEPDHDDEVHAEHEHDELDPHFWLDPSRMPPLAQAVAEALGQLSPEHAATFEANAAALSSQFEALDQQYAAGLATCAARTFVTSHAAFGYLAEKYELQEVAISGLDPESDPSPARIAAISDLVRADDITTIVFETLVSPKVAETLASDLGITAAVLDPLEGISEPDQTYFSIAEENLAALETALGCS